MTNIKTIERPQLFKALEDYIILWSNVTVKYIDTLKAVTKEAVTLIGTHSIQSSNNIEKPFKTLNILNNEIDALKLSLESTDEELTEAEQIFKKYKRVNSISENEFYIKRIDMLKDRWLKRTVLLTSYIEARQLYV